MAKNLIRDGRLYLYGPVGGSFWDETGFTDEDVIDSLSRLSGADVVVHLNSPGGDPWIGTAIYQALKAHGGTVTIHVDALAASAASLIVCAADDVVMGAGAQIMIHDPSTVTWGDADDHRRAAGMLDAITVSAADIYVAKTGLDRDECLRMMADETWLTADEALRLGFADRRASDGAAASMDAPPFDYRVFQKAPANLVAASLSLDFSNRRERAPTPDPAITEGDAPANERETAMSDPNNATVEKKAVETPVATMSLDDFEALAERHGLTAAEMSKARKASMAENGKDIDPVRGRDAVLAVLAKRSPSVDNASPATVTHEARDKFIEGATKGIMARAGLAGGERNEFTGMTTLRLAEASLEIAGVPVPRRGGREALARLALGKSVRMQHGTGDFPLILANVAEKSMLKGYEEAPEVFERFTVRGTLGDYKPATRVDLSSYPTLPQVNEHAEYTYVTLGDRAETIALLKYGSIFSISEESIVNDDLNAFTRIPLAQGRAARRTIGDLVFAVLTGNPTMSDGTALFHADHANLISGGASALSVASLDQLRVKMGTQKDGDAALNINPAHLIVPKALEGAALTLIASEFDPASTQRVPNKVRNMAEVHADARLDAASATAFYALADPNMHDTIEVAYLDGQSVPELIEQEGFDVDGLKMKVKIAAGVAPLSWKTMAKSAGA